jgi:hypothetical protein
MAKFSSRTIIFGSFCAIALLFTNYLDGGTDLSHRLRRIQGGIRSNLTSRILQSFNVSASYEDSRESAASVPHEVPQEPKRETVKKSKLQLEAERRGQYRGQIMGGVVQEMSPWEAIEIRTQLLFEEKSEETSSKDAVPAYQPPSTEHLVVQHASGRDEFLKETSLGGRPAHSARCVEVRGDGFEEAVKPPRGWPEQCTVLILVSLGESGKARKAEKAGGGGADGGGGIEELRTLLSGNASITKDTRVFGPFDGETALASVNDGELDAVYLRMNSNDCDVQQTVFAWKGKLSRKVGVMIGEEFTSSVPAPVPSARSKACVAWKLGDGAVKTAAEDLALMEGANVLVSSEQDKPMWAVERIRAEAIHGVVQAKPWAVRGRRGVMGGVNRTERILHFVWVSAGLEGDESPPQWVLNNTLAWRAMQTKYQWEIRLWNNALVRKNLLPLDDAFAKAPNAAAISDLVRYAAIYLYGGVYMDVDTIPVRPIDDLVEAFSPFGVCEKVVSMPGILRATQCLDMGAAFIAAPAGHESLRRAYQRASRNVKSKEGTKMDQLVRSGPKLWTVAAWEDDIHPRVTALGSSTFMPCTLRQAGEKCWGNVTTFRGIQGIYGHHTSANSWGEKGGGAGPDQSSAV